MLAANLSAAVATNHTPRVANRVDLVARKTYSPQCGFPNDTQDLSNGSSTSCAPGSVVIFCCERQS